MMNYINKMTCGFGLSLLVSMTAHAGEMYVYKDNSGQVLLTNVNPSGNFEQFNRRVQVNHYPDPVPTVNTSTGSMQGQYGNSSASSSANRNRFDMLIRSSAARHGVDAALLKAMMHTESAFNPNARSPAGAQGLMQLMPATARRFSVYNPWNPSENIEGAAKYVAWLMRRFNNNVEHVLAGYNAGEGNVDKYGGIPPFRETQNYVRRVLSRYHSLYKNDAQLFNASVSRPSSNGSGTVMIQRVDFSNTANVGNSASYASSAYAALR